jgi:hypothetical protein
MSAADELKRLINSYQLSQAISVAAELGIVDLLADGARTSDDLADATGTNKSALYRLLRALASVGVLHEEEGQLFALAELGQPLRSDAPDSVAPIAVWVGQPYQREAWSALRDSIRTGENAFRLVHGVGAWEYRAQRPDDSAIFDRFIAALTRRGARALLDAYDFGRFGTIVDVGGGDGTFSRRCARSTHRSAESSSTSLTSLRGSTSATGSSSWAAASSSRCPRAVTRTS